jgi:hypothetical protein
MASRFGAAGEDKEGKTEWMEIALYLKKRDLLVHNS